MSGSSLVAFLNTVHIPDHDDQLADHRAGPWLAAWSGDARDAAVTAGACGALRDLREGIRALAAARDGADPEPGAVERAAAALRTTPLVLDLGPTPRLGAVGDVGAAGRAVAAVAADLLAVHSGGEWARVKVCASAGCRWAFLDTSRNRSRRWCDMSGCGNRAKNQAWRERHGVTAQMT
jgi:predicted RNA-binding Zn ribbon-like protein